MDKKKLRVGVVGVGAIAQTMHLPNWQELANEGRIELVGVCDVDKERVEQVREKFNASSAYTNHKKMLKDGEFDIIDVCTQNRFHCPVTVDALKAGAHVLVEKPIAMSAKEAETMLNTAKAGKRRLMVAQHMRFEAGHEKLKEIIERGELGQIYHANAVMLRRRGIPGWGRFHIQKESLGGPLIDIGVHVMDLTMWLMGFPKPIAASGRVHRMFGDRDDLVNATWGADYNKKEFDVEDYAVALVRFENGASMHIEVSWAANIPEDRAEVRVLGDKAGVSTNPLGVYSYETGALTAKKFDWLPTQQGHRMEIRHFTECIEKHLPLRVPPEQSLVVQKVIDAIYE